MYRPLTLIHQLGIFRNRLSSTEPDTQIVPNRIKLKKKLGLRKSVHLTYLRSFPFESLVLSRA